MARTVPLAHEARANVMQDVTSHANLCMNLMLLTSVLLPLARSEDELQQPSYWEVNLDRVFDFSFKGFCFLGIRIFFLLLLLRKNIHVFLCVYIPWSKCVFFVSMKFVESFIHCSVYSGFAEYLYTFYTWSFSAFLHPLCSICQCESVDSWNEIMKNAL